MSPAPTVGDVEGVIAALDAVVEQARTEGDRLGYFAVMYRTVTVKVKEGIEEGFFDDPTRMEELDVRFANRYLEALDGYRSAGPVTASWRVAFDTAPRWRPVVLQHLLLGINAHINLDLGIAAAQTAPGQRLPGLRADFDRINEILASLISTVARDLGSISPWVGWVNRASGGRDDELVRFSIEVARGEAWRFATELATLPPTDWQPLIERRDRDIGRLGGRVLGPGPWLSTVLLLVRLRETTSVADTIEALGGVPAPPLEAVEQQVDERDERTG